MAGLERHHQWTFGCSDNDLDIIIRALKNAAYPALAEALADYDQRDARILGEELEQKRYRR